VVVAAAEVEGVDIVGPVWVVLEEPLQKVRWALHTAAVAVVDFGGNRIDSAKDSLVDSVGAAVVVAEETASKYMVAKQVVKNNHRVE
jgi:hypothetical protein